MSITLDGQRLFDSQDLRVETGSISRDSIERSAAGVDGVLSIDLGARGRKIKQSGTLRARSRSQVDDRIGLISAFMDGGTHTLETYKGYKFDNLRMDSFKITADKESSNGIVVDYEIIYTQLKV